ncbi:hypothetical protein BLNAU_18594 [Blattamonas nauphoetae]|uniref:Uncharacterized protein n=1 Tax=Blattamonas nauphoetae TaxID=2049346 RepID=A0ABQ9X3Z8_9EUKA|nr:hypothetical protein BLNAU_18594 [Blattamonas nauphoetae]
MQWLNLVFDLPNLVSVHFHDSYLSLHSVSESLLFMIRKVFTLKNQSLQTLLTDCVLSFSEQSHISFIVSNSPRSSFFSLLILLYHTLSRQHLGCAVDLSQHVQQVTLHDMPS